ncbi:hypothetical protein VTI74DRAFT_3489 [Chaetomium olivicolor]
MMGADAGANYGVAVRTTTPSSGRKRNYADYTTTSSSSVIKSEPATITYATYNDTEVGTPIKKARITKPPKTTPTEKRLRKFRPNPPKSFHEIYHRATTQRFYVLSRTRCGTADCPEEMVEMTGSTGNIYTVVVAQQPSCDCPHARQGNQCKHVLYVLAKVLRAKYEYVYQLALLSEELREIFAGAPPPVDPDGEGAGRDGGGKRKPVEGDCPICFCEMEAEGREAVVWCRAACGQNMHKGCFETWAATKRRQAGGGEVTCPYCRSAWEGDKDMLKNIERKGKRNAEGYVNVASQLGISTERDYSTYSRWWSGHPSSYRRRYY